ncbi:hypothetical protein ACFOOM_29240 [Streptomyces echinoruber]|uniref:Uncharacterized protein n=1 Tax=Streptomyces echinoruber TaxID=68898 RepID=A0A918RED5_9ACTN|nr:hypothetical protein [Streptomyces echinoruber]GGZ94225.1 hypothetical protein GCM10010389_36210 [Streptomyces echinoruber]
MSRTAHLELVGLPDTDDEELLQLSAQLRRLLSELDVLDVRPTRRTGEFHPSSKSGELIDTGTIAVTAATFVLRQTLRLADTWLRNRPLRSIRVELNGRSIELGHASAAERERLIDLFLGQDEEAGGDPDERQTIASEPPRASGTA